MRPITVSLGNIATAASPTLIRTASIAPAGNLVLNGTAVANGVATLETDRTVLFTFAAAEPGLRLELTGQSSRGQVLSETIIAPSAITTAVMSVNNYRRVLQVKSNQASLGTIAIGTTAAGASPWVAFDNWAPAPIAIQVSTVGSITYTIQSTLDNPNDVNNPTYGNPGAVTWVNSNDPAAIGATTPLQSNFLFAPCYARLLYGGGTGSATATFLQSGAS